ncbi:hypothetical protein Tdes44962_MAKER04608 [Teratosphaeria destructans]|uniref:Ubiquitin-like domain-containing protein n=1 Tax=Teratosphaeria destructans TaxID=418781 RepID=A0A9W7VZY9_9PEZI|nr:hypothetical protein Tdes44962_MAKER04608 [Teratosphaeria destructans]
MIHDAHDISALQIALHHHLREYLRSLQDSILPELQRDKCYPLQNKWHPRQGQRLAFKHTPATPHTPVVLPANPNLPPARDSLRQGYRHPRLSNLPGLACAVCQPSGYPTTHREVLNGDRPIPYHRSKPRTGMKKIHVLFKDPNGKVTLMPVTSTVPLKYTKAWYAEEVEFDVRTLHFFFWGEAVGDEETAEELIITNGSVVEVNMHMMGA